MCGYSPLLREYSVYLRESYPSNWKELAFSCKERAQWHCEECRVKQGRMRTSKRTGLPYFVYLHAAHRDHDPGNQTPVLLCLCPTCHGLYDANHRRRLQRVALERLKHQMLLSVVR